MPSRPPRRPEPLGRAAILTGGDRLVRALQTSLAGRLLVPLVPCADGLTSGRSGPGNRPLPHRPALPYGGRLTIVSPLQFSSRQALDSGSSEGVGLLAGTAERESGAVSAVSARFALRWTPSGASSSQTGTVLRNP